MCLYFFLVEEFIFGMMNWQNTLHIVIVFLENETSRYYWETISHESVSLAAKEKKQKGIDVITDKEIPFPCPALPFDTGWTHPPMPPLPYLFSEYNVAHSPVKLFSDD